MRTVCNSILSSSWHAGLRHAQRNAAWCPQTSMARRTTSSLIISAVGAWLCRLPSGRMCNAEQPSRRAPIELHFKHSGIVRRCLDCKCSLWCFMCRPKSTHGSLQQLVAPQRQIFRANLSVELVDMIRNRTAGNGSCHNQTSIPHGM